MNFTKWIRKPITFLRLLLQDRAKLAVLIRRIPQELRLQFYGRQPFIYSLNGTSFVCHPDIEDSRRLYLDTEPDLVELSILRCWLRHDDCFLDVGANLGTYCVPIAYCVGPGGKVHAVEASRRMAANLCFDRKLLQLDQLHVHQIAICDHEGSVAFFESDSSADTGTQSLRQDGSASTSVRTEVQASTLRALSTQIGREPHAIKMDIEGAEVHALRLAPECWLSADGPLWLIEVNPAALARFGSNPNELLSFFPRTAFNLWIIPRYPSAGSTDCTPQPLSLPFDWHSALFFNLLAIPTGDRWQISRQRLVLQCRKYCMFNGLP